MDIVDINAGRFLEGSPKLDYASAATAIGLIETIKERLGLYRRALSSFFEAKGGDNVRELQFAVNGVNSVALALKKALVQLLNILLNKSGFTLNNPYLEPLISVVREIGSLERTRVRNQIRILFNEEIRRSLGTDDSSKLAASLDVLKKSIAEKRPFYVN